MALPKLTFLLFAAAAIASSQTLTVISGNGQLIPDGSGVGSAPIVFQLMNGTAPIPNATITFTNTSGAIDTSLSSNTAVTNAAGQASVIFVPSFINGAFYETYTLQATYGTASVIFYETAGVFPNVQITLFAPTPALLNPYTATATQPGANKIVIGIAASFLGGVANVSLKLVPVTHAPPPAGVLTQQVSCLEAAGNIEGKIYSDANGSLTCTPVFAYPNQALNTNYDSLTFKVLVGDYYSFGAFAFNIAPSPLKLSSPGAQLLAVDGQPFSAQFTASGGVPPYSYSLSSGQSTLPPGLNLNSATGLISGTPSVAGLYRITPVVTDKIGATLASPVTLGVSTGNLLITTSSTLPSGIAGQPYLANLTVAGGVPPYSWTVSGSLPPGLAAVPADTVGDTFKISGIPSTPGPSTLLVGVTDAFGERYGPTGFLITIAPPVVLAAPVLPAAVAGKPYTGTIAPASGGTGAYTYSAVGLPPGLALNPATGVITGATASAGTVTVTFTATDTAGHTATVAAPFFVVASPLAYPVPPVLNNAVINTPYSGQVPAPAGGLAPYSYALAPGAPVGVAVTPTGEINGSFTSPGTVTFSIVVTDAARETLTTPYTLTVTSGVPSVSGISNGASFIAGGIAPGELVSIFGTNLGPATPVFLTLDQTGKVPTTLGSVQVLFGSVAAPVLYASATQVNAIAPFALAPGTTVKVTVTYGGVESASFSSATATATPAVFMVQGSTQGAVLNQDYSVNSASNPAAAGSVVQIFGTGSGAFVPAVNDGELPTSISTAPVPGLSVTIGGQPATVAYAGVAPGLVAGVLQVNATVPAGLTAGAAVPVVITIGTVDSSKQTVTIAVK